MSSSTPLLVQGYLNVYFWSTNCLLLLLIYFWGARIKAEEVQATPVFAKCRIIASPKNFSLSGKVMYHSCTKHLHNLSLMSHINIWLLLFIIALITVQTGTQSYEWDEYRRQLTVLEWPWVGVTDLPLQ